MREIYGRSYRIVEFIPNQWGQRRIMVEEDELAARRKAEKEQADQQVSLENMQRVIAEIRDVRCVLPSRRPNTNIRH